MKHERDGRLRSARASVASFPPAEETANERQPSYADASHIARRRASSAPAHEVDLDEVELVDPAPIVETALPTRAPFDVPTTDRPPAPRRTRRPALIAAAVGCSALIGGGLAFFTREAPRPAPAIIAPAVPSPPAPALVPQPTTVAASTTTQAQPPATPSTSATATPSGVPEVDVAALPRPHVGTVIGSPGHRLWIDGALAPSWQASVECGPHVVQVGSAGATRDVDVPCGAEVNVQP